jgi:hypothetical protein
VPDRQRWCQIGTDGQKWASPFSPFVCASKRTNDKLPFVGRGNGKRIKENRLGFRFPFDFSKSSESPNKT